MSKEFPKLVAPVVGIIQHADYSEKACSLEYVQTGADEWRISHYRACKLFQVVLSDKSILYVLAEDAAGAIGQASCRLEEPMQSLEAQQALEAGATAIELPMRIRGWGARSFNPASNNQRSNRHDHDSADIDQQPTGLPPARRPIRSRHVQPHQE